MRNNIETIKFTGGFCLVLAVLTYLVTLNIEIGFFQPHWSWMSNSFALTVCGGAFSSFFVVMLCEIQKYRSNKLSCERFLYVQVMYLYQTLYCMDKIIDGYMTTPDRPIPDNLIDEGMTAIYNQSMAIRNVDYVTFRKNNKLMAAHKHFCSNGLIKAEFIVRNKNYLKIAIIKTQMKNLERTHCQGTVTSTDRLVAKTLLALKKQISPVLKDVSAYLDIIGHNCKKWCDWENQKEKIHENYANVLNVKTLEDFLESTETTP